LVWTYFAPLITRSILAHRRPGGGLAVARTGGLDMVGRASLVGVLAGREDLAAVLRIAIRSTTLSNSCALSEPR
jgi:hypothetical protein